MGRILLGNIKGPKGEIDTETKLTYAVPEEYAEPQSGEKLGTFMGKVVSGLKKLFLDVAALNGKTATVNSSSPWTYIEYNNGLIDAWRYATISSAAGAKTTTLSLPTPLTKEYAVTVFPIFNGHLCKSIWAGNPTGADGRTETTVQISMDSTDSNSNVGVMVYVRGYRRN